MVETSISVIGYEFGGPVKGEHGEDVLLHTTRGEISTLLYQAPNSESAVLWAGSWRVEGQGQRSSPIARAVAQDLVRDGIASLLLRYRQNAQLGACIQDTQAGVSFLEGLGFKRIVLVGHSFSGAVVISVAPLSRAIVAVVALASQTIGANSVAHIHPRPLLLVHGTNDQRLNCYCSEQIYSWARRPKELVILEGASHGLWERKDDLLPLLHHWLTDKLDANSLNPGESTNLDS
jgi:alpha/beta superfamily hydrolase